MKVLTKTDFGSWVFIFTFSFVMLCYSFFINMVKDFQSLEQKKIQNFVSFGVPQGFVVKNYFNCIENGFNKNMCKKSAVQLARQIDLDFSNKVNDVLKEIEANENLKINDFEIENILKRNRIFFKNIVN
jgi:hypothetical protein